MVFLLSQCMENQSAFLQQLFVCVGGLSLVFISFPLKVKQVIIYCIGGGLVVYIYITLTESVQPVVPCFCFMTAAFKYLCFSRTSPFFIFSRNIFWGPKKSQSIACWPYLVISKAFFKTHDFELIR